MLISIIFLAWTHRRTRNLIVIAGLLPLLAGAYIYAEPVVKGTSRAVRLVTAPVSAAMTAQKRVPIYSVRTEEKKLAISFDAAWGADHTSHLLDILDEYEIKTTFFLVTFWVERYPDEAREIVARGHEIGLHSSTHPDFTALSQENMKQELNENARVVEDITGFRPRLFRPPFGAYNERVLSVVEDELGYTTIQWSIDSLDWKDVDADFIIRRIMNNLHRGAIVLLHNHAKHTAAALPRLLAAFKADGWKTVPISELLHRGEYTIDHQGRQVPAR
ncbi:MAG: polysaccharide deacetylase family protein [Thermaerobacterales bacterium]